jgi:glycosyltransferase involved in cell wall biosynthesis
MLRIGIAGIRKHPWQSVDRTRRFYLRTLSTDFRVINLDDESAYHSGISLDGALNFSGNKLWGVTPHPPYPLLFAIHGGAILNQEFLWNHLVHLQSTDVLIVNCSSDESILRKMFTGYTPIICRLPLPVNRAVFQPLDRRECRVGLPIADRDYIVGFVARLLPQKNLHQFLRMLAEIKRRLHPQTIGGIIVGDWWTDYPILDYMTNEYQAEMAVFLDALGLKEDIAYFPAQLGDDSLAVCYNSMDVLIHPTNSIDENFGYTPIEAMACGTPVIAAAYGGIKDNIVSGETGFLMPTWITPCGIRMDVIQGIKQVERLLSDSELWSRISQASISHTREHFNYESCRRILSAAVRKAVKEYCENGGRPLKIADPLPIPEETGLLPKIDRPFESFQNVVSAYVSGPTPRIRNDNFVCLASPVEESTNGRFRLLDHAWPATYTLDTTSQAIANCSRELISTRELRRASGANRDQIQHLVDLGLLICSGVGYDE